ncbi:SDR family NAD(P)-dependent oxidoreductase [Legionella shakespearei]|uniref:Polyketide synthase, type I n=1 Tax=Legionella shakespearei DSM 23087 TaxID=1122169 RepID=A0A0W0YL48_9GAMM|nr:SDR family NAD(P)-dependent oxidoreductase [Legionella shakespearei]KTD57613.1 polyketide synthase, type I [Legionella shakespearei DSM 23087]
MPEYIEDKLDILDEPIAIVGANCQFPGIDKDIEELDAFHEMLLKKQTPIKEVPENRWDIDAYYDPDRQKEDKVVSRKGGFLDNPRLFDAAFFKIPPVEAKQIDPQHRLFLEVAVRALNDANITFDSLKNSNAGVYCGLSTNDYSQLNYKDQIQFNAYTYIGSADSAAAGRLSYFLNLKGPCVTVDTACSSSLSALQLAVMALRTRQCDMAIVGGVHLSLSPEVWIGLSKANMLSAVGESRSFDAQADGYVRSEGCAVVVLKRLDDAVKDHNKIHAVIKSVIMNQDGGGMGMAAPNIEAQIAMHHSALESAHLAASDIDYIETHGTGTVLGDAIELQAIQHIHQNKHAKDNPLVIGALKSNLGHTISTSGIAALIKVIGTFKNEMIPANLHYSTPNQTVDPDSIPALIPIESTPFPRQQNKKRYAQISNFGFTGTNVSAIIEEPPQVLRNQSESVSDEPVCFVLSAKSEFSLRQMLKKHLHYLNTSDTSLSDVCYTLINCRDHFKFRCAIVAQDKESLIKKIESGDYTIQKVAVKKEITLTGNDASQNYEAFLSGANIRSDKSKIQFNPVELPLYVFDRKTYWHDVRTEKEINVAEDWCCELQWQAQPVDKNNDWESGHRWLLIGESQEDFGLKDKGITLLHETEHYVLEELDGIIIAENFNSLAEDIDSRIELQKKTLKKILALLHTLNERAIKLRLIFLTANSTTAHGQDAINIDSSPLEGFCKTLCLELPQYQTILIELDEQNKDKIAEQVIAEMNYNHGQHHEHVVSYRKGKRLVLRLNKVPLPKKKELVHPEGRYLITGGCGGLGLVTAQALLAAGAREVVLVARTVDTPAILANIKALQTNYPDQMIRPVSLDISDKVALQKLLVELNEDSLLKGIIHAAGASMNKPLLEHQEHDIDHVFSAKVKGGWYLHELTQNYDLDFFVVYSSISSVFGSNKEAFYSATNSFLDALIAERQRLNLVGTAIQWGPWAEVGMAKKRSRDQGLKDALIHNEQGEAFVQRLINSPLSHVAIISPAYLQFMLDFVPEPRPAFYQALASALNKTTPTPDIELSPWLNDYSKVADSQQYAACKNLLMGLCKELLELADVDDLDEDAGFFDLGFDSLMMAELSSLLKDNLKPLVQIAATIAFDYPSINKLASHLQVELSRHFIPAQKSNATAEPDNDGIAIIGMSCSLPNAPDLAGFEHLLENGLSGIKAIPIERWDNQLYYDPNPDTPGKTYVSKLGLIDNIKLFDPEFFGISPREAPFLDPQQRLFLEHCYHALEHANYPVQSLRGSATGVFAGVGSSHEYYTLLEKRGFSPEEQGMLSVTGKALNIVSGRVAYVFDFKGPALSIDTACSSSLVAIHYACNSLKNGEIDFALAGGVNILLRPDGIINLSKAKALSPSNQCKTFDEEADGYVRSEGCGVLFLKRMSDALRDKDRILAVIKGTAINNDGKSAGLTVPNGKSQEEVMRKALSQSQLNSTDISYIEAHGTGTSLGDPIEVHAINAVYGAPRDKAHPLYIGAVKTNIGHLESAAGVAGLIKVIIGLQNKKLYKNLNFNRLNPNIKLEASQIAVQNRDWQSNSPLRSAGVSAFGFSGTNAHIILQEFPEHAAQRPSLPLKTNALILSAKSQIALEHLVQSWQQFLATTTDDFTNICFTAAVGRDHYPYRLALIAQDARTASELLKNREYVTSYQQNHDLNLSHDPALDSLVSDYLQGKSVDWALYYTAHHPTLSKVTLPNYTFVRSEFWLDLKVDNSMQRERIIEKNADREDNEQPKLKQSDFVSYETASEHLYEVEWSALNAEPSNAPQVPDFWVISTNEPRAKKVLGSLRYQLIDHFDKLEQVEDKNIIFLYEEDQFYTLFHCCQKMFQAMPKRFILVTENAYAINGAVSGTVNPNQTMAYTFWKSFRNELELAGNYAIDLDAENTLNECLEYIFNTSNEETQFAVRNATLYVPRLKRKKLSGNSMQRFDQEATYLITGGTGGLAKPLIEYLIRNGVKHIVITSRSDCPSETQNLIEHAREKGVDITHYSADASHFVAMEKIITTIQQSAHQLKGVFHLAGVIQNDLIVHLSTEALQQVLRAKMDSALILHQLTKDMTLDMFVLFSSASAILGSRRQSNYAAANGFLDGLAHLRRQHNLPALSINWGVFHTGMAAGKIDSLKKRGFIPLDPGCIHILDSLLQSDVPQIVLCPIQWDLYFKNTPKNPEFSDLDEPMTSLSGQAFLHFLRQHHQKEQNQILSEVVSAIAADVLGLENTEQLRKKNDLFAMGMDSLMSLELRSRIHDKLKYPNLNLPIEYFINDARIDKITANISKELNKFFAQDEEYKPTEDVRAGAVTLSDTQYGFWLINRDGYSANCPRQIQLQGALNVEQLYKAFAFTINQNGAFWLNFNKDIPIQMIKRQGEFTLHYDDISSYYDQNSLNELFYHNTDEEISLTEQPLIRVHLYKLKEDLHELHIIIPHIILDDYAYRLLLKQFEDNYQTVLQGKSLVPVQEQYTYLDYVKQNNRDYEKDLDDKIAFWQAYNSGFQKLNLGSEHHLPDAARQAQNLFHYPMDEHFVEQFKDWHKERNMNVSTGLIAAFQIVFYKLSAQKKIPIMVLHNGREDSRYNATVGLCIEYKRINITLDEQYTYKEFFKSIENEFIKATPFQKCSQYIKSIGFKESPFSIIHQAITLYDKLFAAKKLKVSHPNATARSYYLKNLSKSKWINTAFLVKDWLNQHLHTKLRLLKPNRMSVVFNINASFFLKRPVDDKFADLDMAIPNHYGSVDRAIGNRTLWIFFTKDQNNHYRVSINGPLTSESKDLIAQELNHVMKKIMENDEYKITD